MTLQITPYANVQLYLPIPVNSTPDKLQISSLSFFDISQQIFVANYWLQFGSYIYNVNAFVAYPQSMFMYSPLNSSSYQPVIFRNENIYDETAYALIGNYLVTYSDQAFKTSLVSSNNAVGSQYVVFWNDDILIIYTQPYSIEVYSVNQNKFFTYTIPTNLASTLLTPISVSFLGGYLYAGVMVFQRKTNNVYAYLLSAKFSYSNGQMSIVTSSLVFSSVPIVPSITLVIGVAIRANGSYVVLVAEVYIGVTVIVFIVYDVNTGTSNSVLYNTEKAVSPSGVITNVLVGFVELNIDSSVSIYGYNVFVVLVKYEKCFMVLSFNIKTFSIETITYPYSVSSSIYSPPISIQGNIVYYPTSFSSPVQYGSTYYLPVNFLFFQVTTSEMVGIQITSYQLYKNTLTISGIVKYLQTGQPVPNAYVTIYEYSSVQGNQFAVSKPLTQTRTGSDGSFTLTYKFSNAPPYANIVITASVDPIVVEVVKPATPVIPSVTYYQ